MFSPDPFGFLLNGGGGRPSMGDTVNIFFFRIAKLAWSVANFAELRVPQYPVVTSEASQLNNIVNSTVR